MYLFDTNHCSALLKGNSSISQKLTDSALEVATTVVTMGELILMAEQSVQYDQNIKIVENFLSLINIIHIDEAVAKIYGKIKSDLIKKFGPKKENGRKKVKLHQIGFSDNDLWIACIAIHKDATLLTCDGDFGRIKEVAMNLKVDSWI